MKRKLNIKKVILVFVVIAMVFSIIFGFAITYKKVNALQKELHETNQVVLEKNEKLDNKEIELESLKETISSLEKENDQLRKELAQWRALGTFRITYYCSCSECSESWGAMTATGKIAEVNRTIAVDPHVIPLGSKVRINGQDYIAEDVGGAIKGNRIDIYVDHHDMATEMGVDYFDVKIRSDINE